MRFLLNILPFAVAGSAAITPRGGTYNVIEKDVVVIGGGSSGTYAATRLLGEGKSVVVLEKDDHLGGHTVTYTDPDTKQPFNLGVIFYHNSTVVQNYFGALGVPLQSASVGGAATYYDFATGKAFKDFQPASAQSLGLAIQKYAQILATKYPYLSLGYDIPAPVPKELVEPYSKFIKKNGLGALVQQVSSIAGCNGNLLDRPALYGIKVFGLPLVQAAATGFVNAASGDNLDLYRAAQNILAKSNGAIYNAKVKKVTRSTSGVTVQVNTPKGPVTVKAKKLVLAIPPLKKYFQEIGLDLTAEEVSLFGKFKGYLYGSTVFTYTGSLTKGLLNIGTKTPYNLLTLPGTFLITPLVGKSVTNKISAYFGGLDTSMSEKKVKTLIDGELKNLAKAGNIASGKANYKFFQNHSPYHIHVDAKDVENGFYSKLYALNGKKSTFYTGAAFVDNDSTLIWSWTEAYLLPLITASLQTATNTQ